MSKRWGRPASLALAVVAATAALLAVGDSARARESAEAAPATIRATVQPARSISLSVANGGRLAELLVRPGQRVYRGQLLARVDDASLRLRLRTAELNLATARARLAKAEDVTIARRRQLQV